MKACACWWTRCALHEGHCCMTTENTEANCHPEMVELVKAADDEETAA